MAYDEPNGFRRRPCCWSCYTMLLFVVCSICLGLNCRVVDLADNHTIVSILACAVILASFTWVVSYGTFKLIAFPIAVSVFYDMYASLAWFKLISGGASGDESFLLQSQNLTGGGSGSAAGTEVWHPSLGGILAEEELTGQNSVVKQFWMAHLLTFFLLVLSCTAWRVNFRKSPYRRLSAQVSRGEDIFMIPYGTKPNGESDSDSENLLCNAEKDAESDPVKSPRKHAKRIAKAQREMGASKDWSDENFVIANRTQSSSRDSIKRD